ncbi:hypothetical protein [Thermus islandicus]|uniref:hypothetical protein n=1 Tax=Thermus islandicus TaxID=540988 RepID=UPI00041FEFBF|nr:hypothetical protein [Thermus islandicus]
MRPRFSPKVSPALKAEMAYSGWGYDPEMAALWKGLVKAYIPLAHGIPIRWRVGTVVHRAAAWRKEGGVWTVELSPLLFSRYPVYLGKRYGLPMGLPPLNALVHVLQEEGRAVPLPLEDAFLKLARSAKPVMALVAYHASSPGEPLPMLVEMAVGSADALSLYLRALEEAAGRDLLPDLVNHHLFGPLFAHALGEGGEGALAPWADLGPAPSSLSPAAYRPLFGPPHAGAAAGDPVWDALYGALLRASRPEDPEEALLEWRDYWYWRGRGERLDEPLPSDGGRGPGENGEGGKR